MLEILNLFERNDDFDEEQLRQIELGKRNGVNVSLYNSSKYCGAQMEQLRLGLEQGQDIAKYSNPDYDEKVMEQVRLGIQDNVELDSYMYQGFSGDQLEQLRLGLLKRLNITVFSNMKFSANKMKLLREDLEKRGGVYSSEVDSLRDTGSCFYKNVPKKEITETLAKWSSYSRAVYKYKVDLAKLVIASINRMLSTYRGEVVTRRDALVKISELTGISQVRLYSFLDGSMKTLPTEKEIMLLTELT